MYGARVPNGVFEIKTNDEKRTAYECYSRCNDVRRGGGGGGGIDGSASGREDIEMSLSSETSDRLKPYHHMPIKKKKKTQGIRRVIVFNDHSIYDVDDVIVLLIHVTLFRPVHVSIIIVIFDGDCNGQKNNKYIIYICV